MSHVSNLALFLDSFGKSKKLLEALHTAMSTLNKLSIWNLHLKGQWDMYKLFCWTSGYLKLLNNNDYSSAILVGKNYAEKIDIVKSLIGKIRSYRLKIKNAFNSDVHRIKNRCSINKSFYETTNMVEYFRNSSGSLHERKVLQAAENACEFLNSFCENAVKTHYEDLGFNKFDCSDKVLEVELQQVLDDPSL